MGEDRKTKEIRALCDNGSEVNSVTSRAVQQFKIKLEPAKTTFFGIGGTSLGESLGEIQLKIQLRNGKVIVNKCYVVKQITAYNNPSVVKRRQWPLSDDQLADVDYYKAGKIDALLGVGIWIQVIKAEMIRSSDELALAHKTKLGFVIFENIEN